MATRILNRLFGLLAIKMRTRRWVAKITLYPQAIHHGFGGTRVHRRGRGIVEIDRTLHELPLTLNSVSYCQTGTSFNIQTTARLCFALANRHGLHLTPRQQLLQADVGQEMMDLITEITP